MTLAAVVAALCAWCVLSTAGAVVMVGMVRLRDRQVPDDPPPVTVPAQRCTTAEPGVRERPARVT